MAKTARDPFPFPPRLYSGAGVPMRVIRRYAQAIADEFHPDKIILFGSHAYGTPNEDSDVDLLVIMPTRNQIDQLYASGIGWRLHFRLILSFERRPTLHGASRKKSPFTRRSSTREPSSMKKNDKGVAQEGGNGLHRRRARSSKRRSRP